jgi:hypothetical protein
MAQETHSAYLKALSHVNQIFDIVQALVGSESAATLALWLSTPGCGAAPHGSPSGEAGPSTSPETVLSNIWSILPPKIVSELCRWDGWKKKTIAALLATKRGSSVATKKKEFNPMRLATRIHLCGESVLVLGARSEFASAETLAMPARCNSAACPHCARLISAERSSKVFDVLQTRKPEDLRMMTLTIKNCAQGELIETIQKLHHAFRLFRRGTKRGTWKTYIRGYIWNLEVTWNDREKTWHPHIHVLYDGDFYPVDDAGKKWRAVCETAEIPTTENFNGVWIERLYFKDSTGKKRPVESDEEFYMAANEISKYNVKPLEGGEIRRADTVELLESLFNVRRFGTSGTLSISENAKAKKHLTTLVDSMIKNGIYGTMPNVPPTIPNWELLGGLTDVERFAKIEADPDFYVRTLGQLEYDMPSMAAALRKNHRLALVARAGNEHAS